MVRGGVAPHSSVLSVGRRTGDRFGGDGAVSAEPVLDYEGLPERIGETLSDDPRHAVGIATSGVGRDDADRPLRPKLRLRVDATIAVASAVSTAKVVVQVHIVRQSMAMRSNCKAAVPSACG